MIAVVPGKDYEIGKLYPKEVPVPVGSFFVPAITCNDFVFVAGQMATDENQLDPSVRLPKEVRNWGGPNAVRRQTEFIIKKRLEPALKAGGSSWQNVLKAQIYVPTAADIPDALDVWQQHVAHTLRAHRRADARLRLHRRHGRNQPARAARRREAQEGSAQGRPAGDVGCTARVCARASSCSRPGSCRSALPSSDPFDGLSHAAQVQALAVLSSAEKICRAAGTTLREHRARAVVHGRRHAISRRRAGLDEPPRQAAASVRLRADPGRPCRQRAPRLPRTSGSTRLRPPCALSLAA